MRSCRAVVCNRANKENLLFFFRQRSSQPGCVSLPVCQRSTRSCRIISSWFIGGHFYPDGIFSIGNQLNASKFHPLQLQLLHPFNTSECYFCNDFLPAMVICSVPDSFLPLPLVWCEAYVRKRLLA